MNYAIIMNGNPKMAEAIQIKLFQYGFRWEYGGGTNPQSLGAEVLFVGRYFNTDNLICHGTYSEIDEDETQMAAVYALNSISKFDGAFEAVVEVTLEQVAKKMGIPLDKLRIKK